MCIAIACPKGIAIPDEKILKNCFENNPDGAGFAYNLNGRVVIKKGFMKEKDFIQAIQEHDKRYNLTRRGVLIHTRITTQGGTNQAMTHPFPIVGDEGALKKIEYVSDYAIIHNGIISLCTGYEYKKESSMSDTALFVRDYLTRISTNENWFNNKANMELIEKLIDSKMAILNADGDILMTSGFTLDEGIYYSNTSYKDNYFRKSYTNTVYAYGYNDEDWEAWDNYNSVREFNNGTTKKPTVKVNGIECDKGIAIPAMKLKRGQCIMFDDSIMVDFDTSIDYFITDAGDIYSSYEFNDQYVYLGVGEVYDSNSINPIEVETDTMIYEYDIK